MAYIINSLGEQELFSPEKVYKSIIKVGAKEEVAKKITKIVEQEIHPNISTFEIYKIIKKYLSEEQESPSIKFDLKYAIKKFGPDGFIFEKFIKAILDELGYEVVNNVIVKGKCISYEIDFIAKNENLKSIGECKYRNMVGQRVDVNVILKSFAVLDDIKNNGLDSDIETMVVTNEKFTEKAIRYANCKKIKLLGWKYPLGEGLEKIIDENDFYPITILPSFNKNYLNLFIKENILLVKNLTDEKIRLLQECKINKEYLTKLKKEVEVLIND